MVQDAKDGEVTENVLPKVRSWAPGRRGEGIAQQWYRWWVDLRDDWAMIGRSSTTARLRDYQGRVPRVRFTPEKGAKKQTNGGDGSRARLG